MKSMIRLPHASLGRPSSTVAAQLRGELPQALQAPGLASAFVRRASMSASLLDDLCEERPDDCRFWDVLRHPQARVVATGQQPGAIGGSLLVLYKAATAVALARALEKQHGIPVVPVFWNATDDVDFDEIATIGWHTDNEGLFYLQLPREDRQAESFVGDLPAQGDQAALAALLGRLPAPGSERLRSFRPDSAKDHGEWVDQFLRQVFPGLLVLDARSPSLRRHAAPLFESYLKQFSAARRVIETQIEALEKLGHKRVLAPASVQMGLFLTDGNRRRKTDDTALLLRQVRDNPAGLSPNVILRPLVQDQLLPTVAVVLGPAELAYHLELQTLRTLLNVPQPAMVSRLSGTILPESVWLELQRHRVDVATWLRDPEDALQQTGKHQAAAALEHVQRLWDGFDRQWQQSQVAGVDETVRQRARKGMKAVRDKVARDIAESHTRRFLEQAPELKKATQLMLPANRRQERILAGLWLYAQLGESTGEALVQDATEHLKALENGRDEHAVWVVEDAPRTTGTAIRGEA